MTSCYWTRRVDDKIWLSHVSKYCCMKVWYRNRKKIKTPLTSLQGFQLPLIDWSGCLSFMFKYNFQNFQKIKVQNSSFCSRLLIENFHLLNLECERMVKKSCFEKKLTIISLLYQKQQCNICGFLYVLTTNFVQLFFHFEAFLLSNVMFALRFYYLLSVADNLDNGISSMTETSTDLFYSTVKAA